MNGMLLPSATLLIIDVQNAIDDPTWSRWGGRNHPKAEVKMEQLLRAWRQARRRVIHVHHWSTEAGSTYYPGQPGCESKACVSPLEGETIFCKDVNSAFIGTKLESYLRAKEVSQLVVFGVITNNSVETTVRMAGNLGFEVFLAEDACFTFAKADYSGRVRTAEEVHAMSLANLEGEYCHVVETAQIKQWL